MAYQTNEWALELSSTNCAALLNALTKHGYLTKIGCDWGRVNFRVQGILEVGDWEGQESRTSGPIPRSPKIYS